MSADWASTITINIVLSPSPPARAGFGTILRLVDLATNSLDGERVMSFADIQEAEAARTANDISAGTLEALRVAFSQSPRPARVKVGNVDMAAEPPETFAEALAAVEQVDPDFYGVTMLARDDASILSLSAAVETRNKICVVQSDDATWLTSGLPSGLTALGGRERTAVIYHDADSEYADIAWLASRLVFDPDVQSAGWEGQVREVAPLTTGLTGAQRDFIEANNANAGLPFSSAPVYVSPGVNCAGRGIYEILSGDWFRARVSEDIAFLKLQYTTRGEKLQVSMVGQAAILAILDGRLEQGMAAGHFIEGQTRATAEPITADDIQQRRLRFKVEAQVAQDARLFLFNVYLQNEPLEG